MARTTPRAGSPPASRKCWRRAASRSRTRCRGTSLLRLHHPRHSGTTRRQRPTNPPGPREGDAPSSIDSAAAKVRGMTRILVTGGAGYVGSVSVEAFVAAGHDVLVLDDLSTGHRAAVTEGAHLAVGTYVDRSE